MKTTKQILMAICFIALTAFTSKTETNDNQVGTYYFAYASLDQYSEHIYITPVLFAPESKCGNFTEHYVSLQYNDYMKAEYSGILYKCKAQVFNRKIEMVESRRQRMKNAKKITKITDFEYLCDD